MTTFFDYHAPQPTHMNASVYRDIAAMKRGMTRRPKPQAQQDSGSTLQKIARIASLTRIFGKRKEAEGDNVADAKASTKPRRNVRWEDEDEASLRSDGASVNCDTTASLTSDYGSLTRTQSNDGEASAKGPHVKRKITRWELTGRSNVEELPVTSDSEKDDRRHG